MDRKIAYKAAVLRNARVLKFEALRPQKKIRKKHSLPCANKEQSDSSPGKRNERGGGTSPRVGRPPTAKPGPGKRVHC